MSLAPATVIAFNTALDEIETAAENAKDSTDNEGVAQAFVYSGGHAPEYQHNIPAIHLTQDAAIADWARAAIVWLKLERAASFRIIGMPKVEKLLMTETGEDGAQRLTATRYGVTSKMIVLARRPAE